MYKKKLHISKIFSNLEFSTFKLYNLVMCNLYYINDKPIGRIKYALI